MSITLNPKHLESNRTYLRKVENAIDRAKGSLILNNSKVALVIRLSASTAPAGVGGATSISIPANGGNYLLPPEYQGAIQGLLAATGVSNVQFIEPNY